MILPRDAQGITVSRNASVVARSTLDKAFSFVHADSDSESTQKDKVSWFQLSRPGIADTQAQDPVLAPPRRFQSNEK